MNAAPSDLHNVDDHNDTLVGSSSGQAPGFMAQCRDKVCPCHGPRLIHAEIVHSPAERLHTFRGTNERLDRQCRPLVSSDLSMRQQVLQPWAMVCTKRTLAGRLVLECVFVRSCFELLSPFTGRCGVSGLFPDLTFTSFSLGSGSSFHLYNSSTRKLTIRQHGATAESTRLRQFTCRCSACRSAT